jgi:thiol:disulfide interchange protein DsbA
MKLRLVSIIATFAALTLGACDQAETPANGPAPAASAPAANTSGSTTAEAEAAADAATADEAVAGTVVESAGRFRLGTHYQRLSPTQRTMMADADSVEVTEAFWYGCPHCYAAEPFFERWLETKPSHVTFVRLPITWDEVAVAHARLFYAAEAVGKLDEMHTAIFDAIHKDPNNRNPLLSEAQLVEFFGRYGVSAEQFREVWNSQSILEVKLPRAFEFMQRYEVDGVPRVIINGKYTTSVSDAGSHEAMFELIDELVATEHAGD